MKSNALPEYDDYADDIVEIVISADEIERRVWELGRQISADYKERLAVGRPLILVGVLKGVVMFMADLLRTLTVPTEVYFMDVAAYSADTRRTGLINLAPDLTAAIPNQQVLFVEDVIDAGLTLNYLLRGLYLHNPAGIEVCTIFSKEAHRLIETPIKYVGFNLPNKFVVGYGLDYKERYRNLPFVGLLRSDLID